MMLFHFNFILFHLILLYFIRINSLYLYNLILHLQIDITIEAGTNTGIIKDHEKRVNKWV